MRGKLIVIEGTDASGKETQSNLLKTNLEKEKIKVFKTQFPRYDTPTGKIVGGPYLGKSQICKSYFEEGATNVDPRVASLYYAADRLYNIKEIEDKLKKGYVVILDRYIESNMAHQGSKLKEKQRKELFKFFEELEYKLLKLPKPDLVVFLHMPEEYSYKLKMDRNDLDEHEKSREHLKQAEKTYLELAKIYGFKTVNCIEKESIRSIDDISKDVLKIVKEELNG